MLEKKKKISKKEMKQDTLVTTYYQALDFYKKYQFKILIGVAVVALVVVSSILYMNKKANDNVKASELLTAVVPVLETGAYTEAIEGQKQKNMIGLKEIVSNYGGTENGETARIYYAHALFATGKYDEAYDQYNDYSGSNPLLVAAALAGKAYVQETKKEYEDAHDNLVDAAKVSKINPSNPEYLLRAAVNLIEIKKNKEAIKLLKQIKEEYKNAGITTEVDKYLVKAGI
ncbi:hypothetical protein APF79_05135 [bacterium BRH_c32]|nr:MAG: hypothetical protein APF79_05135 [bacterium BRH_c32]